MVGVVEEAVNAIQVSPETNSKMSVDDPKNWINRIIAFKIETILKENQAKREDFVLISNLLALCYGSNGLTLRIMKTIIQMVDENASCFSCLSLLLHVIFEQYHDPKTKMRLLFRLLDGKASLDVPVQIQKETTNDQ